METNSWRIVRNVLIAPGCALFAGSLAYYTFIEPLTTNQAVAHFASMLFNMTTWGLGAFMAFGLFAMDKWLDERRKNK